MASYLCHRCQSPVEDGSPFCAQCGAPQLTVELPDPDALGTSPALDGSTEGPGDRGWATAVSIAGKLGVPAGVLGSLLSFGSLWVLAGSLYATVLYRRQVRTRLTRRVGARMGSVLGLFAAVVATAADATKLLFSRYALHHGSQIDGELHGLIQSGVDRVLANNPDAARQIPWFFHFWLSPDGQAALLVSSALFSAGFMIAFATLGGALGARFLRARQA
jgi:hypothetical protein